MDLTKQELERYQRHLILPEIGKEGQLKLKAAKVLLIGAGGLGSPQAIYLAAAGVGTIGIVDFDRVELSNIHRQILHTTADIGKSKVLSAQKNLASINPHVKTIAYQEKFQAKNAARIIQGYDVVIDGTDNFPTRYLINDACVFAGKPFIFGGIFRFEGQCSVFGLNGGPCYRCLFQEPPSAADVPSCAEAGVLGILPGIIGLLQANEAVKLICGIGEPLKGRLLIFDGLATRFREVRIKKDPQCPLCGPHRTIHALVEYTQPCQPPVAPAAPLQEIPEITVQELHRLMSKAGEDFVLLDVREPMEWEIAHIEGAVLKPLSTLENNYQDIPKDKPVYAHCKVGERSTRAIRFLKTKGYTNCVNVKGGIDAWANQIDLQMPAY